jgi:precorrin-8X/cobalt-precorrin-8 methylmutase
MTLFDAYLVVDWSAESRPKRGADSIWYCLLERRRRGYAIRALENPATRAQALDEIRALLGRLADDGRRVLAGFDFPNAYPRGFARRAGFRGPAWRAVWDGIAGLVEDGEDNANNRFEVAAGLNRRISGSAFPFWGCPKGRVGPYLSARKVDRYAAEDLPERRLCEAYVPTTQPCWKLAYTGSVGSQALMGIPVQRALRRHPRLAERTRVWPFETGLGATGAENGAQVVLSEVYPSLAPLDLGQGEVKDARQVSAAARLFADRDEAGLLAHDLTGPAELQPSQRRLVEREEGWLLGAGTLDAAPAYDYIREPDAIYRESFARIRKETRLDHLPADIARVAVRLVHASAMPEIVDDLAYTANVVRAAKRALKCGAPVICDAEMVRHGVIRSRLPAANRVLCTLNHKRAAGLGKRRKTTRSAAAVDLWRPRLDGAVVAIGNAPTALFRLLEGLGQGWPKPAAILAFPVGFVGAAESKAALIEAGLGVPYLTLRGRRGGSALAAAAVNALGTRPGGARR